MIKYIKFTVGNVREGYKTIEISIGTKNVTYKILRNGLFEVGKKKSRTVEVDDKWLAEFDALNVFAWAKDYCDVKISGDTQWEFIFKHGRKNFRSHGSNSYPENWVRFLDWLDKLIPEMYFVNRKQVEKVTLNYSRGLEMGDEIFETLTLDRSAKTLTLDKKNSKHIYNLNSAEEKLFDAAQIFFDNLEVQPFTEVEIPKIKIELIRHDGSIDNFETLYGEGCLPGLTEFVEVIKGFASDLSAEIFLPSKVELQNQQGKYIFCKVQFKGSYKSYSYRTEDETLAVGDVVDVPVGKNNDVAQAKIVEIGYFDEEEAPFSIDKIKMIIGKHLVNDWEDY